MTLPVVWHSNAPWVGSGYGQQTALFTPLIAADGHDIAISAFYGLYGDTLDWQGIPVYPGDAGTWDKWLPAVAAEHGGGDLSAVQIITLMDVWVLNAALLEGMNVACWVPVDHEPVPPNVLAFFKRSKATAIAMSRFGQRMLKAKGIDALYVPHGVDTTVLKPLDEQTARAAIGMPTDKFVVGMVAANRGNAPARKAFPQAFEAFGRFHKEHPDSMLYLHSTLEAGADGLDLVALCELTGIPIEAVQFTPPYSFYRGFPHHQMRHLYSAFDVLLSPSYGEGFGVPILEAQACGTPVIVTDFSAMTELAGPAGWLVEGERWYHAQQGAFYKNPSVDSIEARLHDAYEARHDWTLSNACVKFAAEYDAELVMERHWRPALAELEVRLPAPELQPLTA